MPMYPSLAPIATDRFHRARWDVLCPGWDWPAPGIRPGGLPPQVLPARLRLPALPGLLLRLVRATRAAALRVRRKLAVRSFRRGAGDPPGANLDRAARLLARGAGPEALSLVDRELDRFPRRPEALVLKARLVLAVHRDVFAARRYCQAAMGLTQPADTCFQSALEVFLSTAAARRPG